jgi:hypothetical protein
MEEKTDYLGWVELCMLLVRECGMAVCLPSSETEEPYSYELLPSPLSNGCCFLLT